LAASGTAQVFTATGAGTITYIHLTFGPVTGGDAANVIQNSTLNINCDGNPQLVSLGGFFLSQDSPAAFDTEYIGIPSTVAGFATNETFNRRTQINFYSGCTMTVVNASSTGASQVFADVAYRSGTPSSGPTNYWNAFTAPFQQLPANTSAYNFPQVYILPPTTFSGGGEFEYIEEYFNSASSYGYMESTPIVLADSGIAAQSGGHEDFYGSGYYCNAVNGTPQSFTTSKYGCLLSAGLQNKASADDFVGYRFFTSNPADNIFFNSTLSVSSANGGSNCCSAGTVGWGGMVSYFSRVPTVAQINFSPAAGTYTGTQSVALSGGPTGDYVCYATGSTVPVSNGSGGCSTGTLYSSAASVATSETLNAVGAKSGYNSSPMSSAAYIINAAYSSPTYRTTCNNTPGAGTTTTVNCTLTPTAGDLVFAVCRGGNASQTSYTVTSSPSGTYAAMTIANGAGGSSQASYGFGATGGSTTFTCTTGAGGTNYQGIQVLDYAPGSVTSLAAGSSNVLASTSTFTSAAISTTGAAFFIACGDAQYGPPTLSVGNINGNTATARTLASPSSGCEDLSVASSATSATGTIGASSAGTWDGVIAAFH
jgi:hypothetical protein